MIILSKCGYAESLQNSVNFWVITKEFPTIEDLLVNFAEDLLHSFRIENKGLFSHNSALNIDNPFKDWILNLCNGICDGSYSSYYFEGDTRDYCFSVEDSSDLTKLLNLKTNDVIFIDCWFEEIILSLVSNKNTVGIFHLEDNTRRVELDW